MSAEAAPPSPFAHLSNDELRQELTRNGIPSDPITATNREEWERQLQNALEGIPAAAGNGNGSLLNGSANDENGGSNGDGNGGGGGQRETSSNPTTAGPAFLRQLSPEEMQELASIPVWEDDWREASTQDSKTSSSSSSSSSLDEEDLAKRPLC